MDFETKTFQEYRNAVSWARTYAREHCYPHQYWRVEALGGGKLAVAVRSRNSGALSHYATEE